ncbi:MAG: hypothetical protein ACRDO7_15185, partial [Nocardioidaceae bacterium]
MTSVSPTENRPAADAATTVPRTRAHRGDRVKIAVGAAIVGLYILAALLAAWIRPYDPLTQDVVHALQGPSGTHLFGTDELGRDVLSRVLTAARIDLPVAALATLLPCLVGTVLG